MRPTHALLGSLLALGCGCGTSTVGRAVGPGLAEVEAPPERFSCAMPEGGFEADELECAEGDAAPFLAAALALAAASHSGEGLVELYESADAPFVQGRLADRDAHDVTTPVSAAARRARAAGSAVEHSEDEAQHTVLQISGQRAGDEAHVEGRWMTYWGSGEDQYRVGFSAELSHTEAGWRFRNTRSYLMGSYTIGGPGDFDAAYYAALDAAADAARARLASEPGVDRRRLLRDAMQSALQLPSAFEEARAIAALPGATAQDHGALAEIARAAGDLGVERRARIAQRDAPMGDLRAFARRSRCPREAPWADYPPMPSDDDYDENAPEPCMYEEITRVHSDEGSPRDLALIRRTEGFAREQTVVLLGGREGVWERLGWVGMGASSLQASTPSLDVSDLELRQLVPDGPQEALMRYDARFDGPGGRAVRAAGFIVCLELTAEGARCARVPTLEEGLAAEGSVARATVTFDEGTFTTSDVEGPYSRPSGEQPIESLFDDSGDQGIHWL